MKTNLQFLVFSYRFSKLIICISLLITFHLSLVTSLFAVEKVKIEEVVVTAARVEEPLDEKILDIGNSEKLLTNAMLKEAFDVTIEIKKV